MLYVNHVYALPSRNSYADGPAQDARDAERF
jgi:hypothetical protein